MPHDSRGNTGGGSTFVRNMKNTISDEFHFVENVLDADILFIPGATLCDRETYRHAQHRGIPIILRVDNVPEDIRNRGTGISRLYDFAKEATFVIFQSQWSKETASPITGPEGPVIYNGVDTNVFNPRGRVENQDPVFVYVKHSRNECKRFPEAQTLFREYSRINPNAHLHIVGRYSKEMGRYNFGFYNDEKFTYHGILDPYSLSDIYKKSDYLLFPSYGDSCPNVVLEAMASGCKVLYNRWGGTIELVGESGMALDYNTLGEPGQLMKTFVEQAHALPDPVERVNKRFTIERMIEEYEGVFKLACKAHNIQK
jgi:glycosyltransferase involved in cell wall biosynthesis